MERKVEKVKPRDRSTTCEKISGRNEAGLLFCGAPTFRWQSYCREHFEELHVKAADVVKAGAAVSKFGREGNW